MDKYAFTLQIIAILVLLFIVYLSIKYIISLVKLNRLAYYSLNIDKTKDESIIINFVRKVSKIVESLVIFNGIGKTYDKYIYEDSRLKKGIDYVAIKILLGFLLVFINLFINALYRNTFSALLLIISFVLGFLSVDFYCLFTKKKRSNLLNKKLLGAIIIMNNCYKANESTQEAIKAVIDQSDTEVAYEFKIVLNDIKIGMDISDAFLRMYERTNLKAVFKISQILKLVTKSGVNVIDAFRTLEKEMIEEERFNNELFIIRDANRLGVLIFALLPLVFTLMIIAYNSSYIDLLFGTRGIFIILILAILYILYIFILKRIIRGDKYVR